MTSQFLWVLTLLTNKSFSRLTNYFIIFNFQSFILKFFKLYNKFSIMSICHSICYKFLTLKKFVKENNIFFCKDWKTAVQSIPFTKNDAYSSGFTDGPFYLLLYFSFFIETFPQFFNTVWSSECWIDHAKAYFWGHMAYNEETCIGKQRPTNQNHLKNIFITMESFRFDSKCKTGI